MSKEIDNLFEIEQEKIITSPRIAELRKEIYEVSKKIKAETDILEKYEDFIYELSLEYQREMFKRGFKIGMRLAKEVYN